VLRNLPREPGMRNLRDQVAAGRIALPMNKHPAILHRAEGTARRRIANSEFGIRNSEFRPAPQTDSTSSAGRNFEIRNPKSEMLPS
jgi:hypothetical protein